MSDPIESIIQSLVSAKNVLITTHVKPDGDALGSAAALQLGLRARGIASAVLLLSRLPNKYSFVFNDNGIEFRAAEAALPEREWFDSFDRLVCVDTGTFSQLPGLESIVPSLAVPKIVIDHHKTQEAWADTLWQDVTASAAGEMIETLFHRWEIPITPAIANCLFVAIASDTGWFQFSNTTPRTLRLVATLMEHGVNSDALYQHLYQNERAERLLLQQRAMGSLRFDAEKKIASMIIRKTDFAETGAYVPDTENLINIPLQVASVQASVLFVEQPEGGPIRVSFRSKGQIDVASFAQQFGGGGHARASGAKLDGSLDDARERVVSRLVTEIY
jgi:phosphoesterase RecJ-like protein